MGMRRIYWNLLKVSLTGVVLYYIFASIPFSAVVASVKSAKPGYVGSAYLIVLVMTYINASQMKVLTDRHGMSLTTNQIFEINLITRFYSMFLPGNLSGAAIRWYKLSSCDRKWMEGLACIAFSRLINTIMLVVLGVGFWIVDKQAKTDYRVGVGLLFFLGAIVLVYLFVFDENGLSFSWGRLRERDLWWFGGVGRTWMDKLVASTGQFRNLPKRVISYVVTLAIWRYLLGIFSLYLLVLSVGMAVPFIVIGWIGSVIHIISMLPITVSGLGVRELGLVVLLESYRVPATDALAISLLLFGRIVVFGVVGGFLEARRFFSDHTGSPEKKGISE